MDRDIHHLALHFHFVMRIHLWSTLSLFVEMAKFVKKGRRDVRKRKKTIVEDSKGNNTEINNVDAKKIAMGIILSKEGI